MTPKSIVVTAVFAVACCSTGLKVLWDGFPPRAQAQSTLTRLNQTPDCLSVENHHSEKGRVKSVGVLDTRLHLYIFVPRTTTQFSLGIFDGDDDVAGSQPSSWELFAPDGTTARMLDAPKDNAWADTEIETQNRWGVWRLSVTGPQDDENSKAKARNDFRVRTRGGVDLYLKPEPVMRVRGLRLGEPRFGGAATHEFWVQSPDDKPLRFNFLWPVAMTKQPQLGGDQSTLKATWRGLERPDDRLDKKWTLRFLESQNVKPGWNRLTVGDVRGVYGLGSEQEARLFFHPSPLMPTLRRVAVQVVDAQNRGVAARLDYTSPQTSNENGTTYTDVNGRGALWILPGVSGRVQVSRGFAWQAQNIEIADDKSALKVLLEPSLQTPPGWFSGDNHMHTLWYDGTHTPAQMVEAARANGLDWITLTEHGHSEQIERTERANAEAVTLSEAGRFVVIPGMEYTGPVFHANIIGGMVRVPANSSLQTVMDAAQKLDSENTPIAFKLNHPTLGKKTAAEEARRQTRMPMLELWNSEEPGATLLWWELLNKGWRTVAEASSDSHHRQNIAPGERRTYIYLGEQPLTQANIIRALRDGRSVLSRGAWLDFSINEARPGATIRAQKPACRIEVRSARPIEKVQIVGDGKVVQEWPAAGKSTFAAQANLPAAKWYVAQAMERGSKEPLAMSNPIWIKETP